MTLSGVKPPTLRFPAPVRKSYFIQIDSDRSSLSWVMIALPHIPTDNYLSTFDQVKRWQFGETAVWTAVRGDQMSETFLQYMAEGYVNGHQAWQAVDLARY